MLSLCTLTGIVDSQERGIITLEIKDKEKLEEKKQTEFSDKIDELNQETDTLLEEIDKWQM